MYVFLNSEHAGPYLPLLKRVNAIHRINVYVIDVMNREREIKRKRDRQRKIDREGYREETVSIDYHVEWV
jgi:hypothetical protein